MENSIPYEDAGLLLGTSKNTIIGYSTQEKGRIYTPDKGVPYPKGMEAILEYKIELTKKKIHSSDEKRRKQGEQELQKLKSLYNLVKKRTYDKFMRYLDSIRDFIEKGLVKKLEQKEKKKEYYHFNERELDMSLDKLTLLTLKKIYRLKKSLKQRPDHKKEKKLERISELETKYRSVYFLWKQGIFDN